MPISFQDLQAASVAALNFAQLASLVADPQDAQMAQAIATTILHTVGSQVLAPAPGGDQGEDPGVDPGGMSPEEEEGILAMFSVAFDVSGAAQFASEKNAFLTDLLWALREYANKDNPPTIGDLRALLDTAMIQYSDSDGDGQANLPLMPDAVVEAFWQSLLDQGLLGRVG